MAAGSSQARDEVLLIKGITKDTKPKIALIQETHICQDHIPKLRNDIKLMLKLLEQNQRSTLEKYTLLQIHVPRQRGNCN